MGSWRLCNKLKGLRVFEGLKEVRGSAASRRPRNRGHGPVVETAGMGTGRHGGRFRGSAASWRPRKWDAMVQWLRTNGMGTGRSGDLQLAGGPGPVVENHWHGNWEAL